MNFRFGTLYAVLVCGTVISVVSLLVRPVEARNFSFPLLPARFFSTLPPLNTLGFALQEPPSSKKTEDDPLPDGKGKDLVQKYCNTCHGADTFTKKHHTRDQWSSVIDDMVTKGLDAPDSDLDTITDYLAAHFGPSKSAPGPATPDAPATQPPQ
jgi:mono/diheme cytochrome c family protein